MCLQKTKQPLHLPHTKQCPKMPLHGSVASEAQSWPKSRVTSSGACKKSHPKSFFPPSCLFHQVPQGMLFFYNQVNWDIIEEPSEKNHNPVFSFHLWNTEYTCSFLVKLHSCGRTVHYSWSEKPLLPVSSISLRACSSMRSWLNFSHSLPFMSL